MEMDYENQDITNLWDKILTAKMSEVEKFIYPSKIWSGKWLDERMTAYGKKDRKELEEHYKEQSLLKKSVYPEDIAEAAFFMASNQSAKSTGNIINVDAGNIQSFTR